MHFYQNSYWCLSIHDSGWTQQYWVRPIRSLNQMSMSVEKMWLEVFGMLKTLNLCNLDILNYIYLPLHIVILSHTNTQHT